MRPLSSPMARNGVVTLPNVIFTIVLTAEDGILGDYSRCAVIYKRYKTRVFPWLCWFSARAKSKEQRSKKYHFKSHLHTS